MSWKAEVTKEDYARNAALRIWEKREDGSVAVLMTPTLQTVAPYELGPETPFLQMDNEKMRALLQAIVDAAWDYGIKPGVDLTAAYNVQRIHLDDMRRIVATQLGVEEMLK